MKIKVTNFSNNFFLTKKKLLKLIMRTFLLLFCTTVFSFSPSDIFSQNVKIYIDEDKILTVDEVFDLLRRQTDFTFIYEENLFKDMPKVHLKKGTVRANKLLKESLSSKNFELDITNNNMIVIVETPEPVSIPQQLKISGTIKDVNGAPLPGTNILEKGTTNGVQSDFDGNFSITVLNESSVLVISYIGFETKEVAVGNQTEFSIILNEDPASLDEVIVIGYGATIRKKDLTGAVSSANLDKVSELPNVSIAQALQGSVAGLNIGATTTAGQNPVISIRGQSTLNGVNAQGNSTRAADNAPLIVLDGIIYRGALVDLNPADIGSIDILKDASSAAIYGSQASNGVILITTKQGKRSDKPIIEYNASYSIQSPTNEFVPMQAAEYEEFYQDIFWAEGGRLGPDFLEVDPDYIWQGNFKTNEIAQGYADGIDTPWWDLFTGDGFVNTQNISIRGKTEAFGYFISGGITDQKAYLKNDKYTRYNFRANFDAKINDWIKIGTQSFVSIGDYSGVTAGTATPFRLQPWAPISDENGEIIAQPEGLVLNPFLTVAQDDSNIDKNYFINLYADINLPLKGLSYRVNYSNNYRTQNSYRFNPSGNGFTGSGYKDYGESWDWTLDNILTYKKTFNQDHNFNVTLLYGVEKRNINSFRATGNQFDVDLLGYDFLGAGDPLQNVIRSDKEEESSLYTMARLLYNYKDKYYFTGTVRRDGFSGFGSNDKIGVFPTFGLGWVISNENLFKDSSWLNFFKLRGSYGQTGRRGIGRYDTLGITNRSFSYVFEDGGQPFLGQQNTSLPNDALGWETTTGLNLGLDFALFNSKIRGNVEYYNNKTENILFSIDLPTITGFDDINTNIAEVSNHGLEFTLSSTIVKTDAWSWEASVNFSRYRNNIESILGADVDGDGIEDDLIENSLFIGEPQDLIYNYEVIGMWQLADEADGSIWPGFLPGTYILNDLDESGDISSLDDRKIIGYEDPDYRFGIANTVNYKNLSLYVFINSIQGGSDFYYGNDTPHAGANWGNSGTLASNNVPSGAWDYWMPENPDAKYRRLDAASALGGNIYNQRSFVRLQDVSLSYSFPRDILETLNLSRLKLFVSGRNLATWTKWNGQDPETGVGFATGNPILKSYSMGLNVQF